MTTAASSRVWFITGVSSGFGSALADAALRRGDRVVGTLRQESQTAAFEDRAPGRARAVRMDVTRPEAVRAGVEAALAAFGVIDVLVNNAGYALQLVRQKLAQMTQELGRWEDVSLATAFDEPGAAVPL